MAQGQGHQLVIGLFEEDNGSYGQDPGTPDGTKLYIDEFTLSATQEYDEDSGVPGRDPDSPLPGVIDCGGSIKPKLSPENVGTLIKHALGVDTPTGVGPYTHTITVGDLPTGLTFDKDMGARLANADRYEKFNGCRVASMALEFTGNSQPTLTFELKGAKSTLPGSALDATLTDNGNTKFSLFNGTVEEGGSPAGDVMSGSLSYTNNLDEDGYAINDAGIRSSLDEGKVGVSGTITARFKTKALLDKAINNTETSLKFVLSQGDGLGSSGNGYLEFHCQKVVLKRKSPEVSGPHGIMVSLDYVGYGSSALQCVLKNALATI